MLAQGNYTLNAVPFDPNHNTDSELANLIQCEQQAELVDDDK